MNDSDKENLQRIKYSTLLKYIQSTAVFRTQLNIDDGAFMQKYLTFSQKPSS